MDCQQKEATRDTPARGKGVRGKGVRYIFRSHLSASKAVTLNHEEYCSGALGLGQGKKRRGNCEIGTRSHVPPLPRNRHELISSEGLAVSLCVSVSLRALVLFRPTVALARSRRKMVGIAHPTAVATIM